MPFPLGLGQRGEYLHILHGGPVVQNGDAAPGQSPHALVHMEQQGDDRPAGDGPVGRLAQVGVAVLLIDGREVEQAAPAAPR